MTPKTKLAKPGRGEFRITNSEVLDAEQARKAAITAADNLATSGKLNDAQADRFIDFVIDITMLKGSVRVARFRNEHLNIDKIGVGSRVTMPKAEAADPGVRRSIQTSKIVLTPQELMTPFEISDTFAEVNLEGETVEDTIVRLMATQMANDVEELYILGDVLGIATLESNLIDGGSSSQYVKDTFLALMNGWLRLADAGNIHDAQNAPISNQIFTDMLTSMPYKFRRNRARLRFFANPDIEQAYRNTLGNRSTALGDAALTTFRELSPFGIPLLPIPLLPANPPVVEHVVLTAFNYASLRYAPILAGSEVVTTPSLGKVAVTPYQNGTDYDMDYVGGRIRRHNPGGAIGSGATVKVTYQSGATLLLTHFQNFIIGIGRDIRIERDRNIYKGVNEFAITTKVAVQIEEATAIVKSINIGTP